jgi:hypothetical protein
LATHTIQITSIVNNAASDPNNSDELVLICQADGGAPVRYPFQPGTALPSRTTQALQLDSDEFPPLFLTFERGLIVSLYEVDQTLDRGQNDYSGSVFFVAPGLVAQDNTVANPPSTVMVSSGRDRQQTQLTWRWADGDEDGARIDEDNGPLTVALSGYFYNAQCATESRVETARNADDVPDLTQVPLNPEFVSTAQDALGEWLDDPDSQAFLQQALSLPQPELRSKLAQAVQHRAFSDAVQMIRDNKVLLSEDCVVGSITMTISAEVTLGLGVAGSITYAVDPHDPTEYTLSVGGTLAIGLEEEAELGVEFGACAAGPKDVGGFDVGGEVTVTDGAGITAGVSVSVTPQLVPPALLPDLKSWSVSVGPAFGEGVGGALTLGYSQVVLSRSIPNIAQPPAPRMLMINNIQCVKKDDLEGEDEIYIEFQTDTEWDADGDGVPEIGPVYRLPLWGERSIGEGQTWNPGQPVMVTTSLSITLKETTVDAGNKVKSGTLCHFAFDISSCPVGECVIKVFDEGGFELFDGDVDPNEVHYELRFTRLA